MGFKKTEQHIGQREVIDIKDISSPNAVSHIPILRKPVQNICIHQCLATTDSNIGRDLLRSLVKTASQATKDL